VPPSIPPDHTASRFRSTGRVAFVETGPADGAPVVLLNGLGLPAAEWRHQAEALASPEHGAHRVVAVDRRGHGRSAYTAVGSMDELVADVIEVMDFLGVESADLCGLSLGGTEALALSVAFPHRVRRLALADTFAELPPALAEARMQGMRASAASGMNALAEAVVDGMLYRTPAPERRTELIAGFEQLGEAAFFELMTVLYECRLDEQLARVSSPTLVIGAAQDTRTPPQSMRSLAGAIPGARFQEIPDAGHFPHLEQPDLFSAALGSFFGA
jgi:3-oxoadipate enol-lactonase